MPRARVVLAVACVAVFWLLAAGWLTAPLLDWAQKQPYAVTPATFAPRTVIVMLGTGTGYDADQRLVPRVEAFPRIATSAAIYAACKRSGSSCKVIIAGGNPQRHEASEADTYLPYLLVQNVPRSDVILENQSLTTYQNARNVAAILRDTPYDTLILVTSAYHMPRSLLDFHRFNLTPQPVVSNTLHVRPGVLPRIRNLVDANMALHELIGIAQFHVYRAIGWF
jgi:uncharacterized SAM-binding protein YcdF (DUF218 family)